MGEIALILALMAPGQVPRTAAQTQTQQQKLQFQDEFEYPLNLEKEGIQLPWVYDTKLREILRSKRTIFYKLPEVYQFYIPPSQIKHVNLTLGTETYTTQRAVYGVYYTEFLSLFNANADFPWEGTVGLNAAKRDDLLGTQYGAVNFIHLPENKPILILNERPIKWIFPAGTMAAEILWTKDSKGKKWVYEIRTRTKDKECEYWTPGIYRPLGTDDELCRELGIADYIPAKKHLFFRNPEEDEVFKMDGMVERLPDLSEDETKRILQKGFKDVTHNEWSPASDQKFSILPKDYSLGLITVDEVSCASCHRQTQISVRNLIPKEPLIIKNPGTVGNIRGCDGIFTWHPFSKKSVRKSSSEPTPPAISLRKYDTENGFVKLYKSEETGFDLEDYKITEYVQSALEDYELPENRLFLHSKKSSVPPAKPE